MGDWVGLEWEVGCIQQCFVNSVGPAENESAFLCTLIPASENENLVILDGNAPNVAP